MRQVVRIKDQMYGGELYVWECEPNKSHGTLKVFNTGSYASRLYPAKVIASDFEVVPGAGDLLVPEGL
jgi:hypothetical protein